MEQLILDVSILPETARIDSNILLYVFMNQDYRKNQILLASQIRSQFKISFWDSIILSSSVSASCPILYSEDMQPGLKIMGTEIINPFT